MIAAYIHIPIYVNDESMQPLIVANLQRNIFYTYSQWYSDCLSDGMNFVFLICVLTPIKKLAMQYHTYSSTDNPKPTGVPEREQPPNPGPEITPPPSPQGPPPHPGPEITPPPSPLGPPPPVPNEVPDHDIHRTPPDPKAEDSEKEALIAEQDREDVQERSPDLLKKK